MSSQSQKFSLLSFTNLNIVSLIYMYLYLHNNIKKSPVDFNSKNELKKWN